MTESSFLETIKTRITDAQKRWQEAQQKLQAVQQEFQVAQLELTHWQGAMQAEMRRTGQLPPTPAPPQPQPSPQPRIIAQGGVVHTDSPAPNVVVVSANSQPLRRNPEPQSDVNKTELVREILRQHPTGMSPAEIWETLKDEMSRDYIYAVLKRLKDRNQIVFQRKRRKYLMRVPQKPEEDKVQTILQ